MKSSEIKLGELVLEIQSGIFGIVYYKNDKGLYLVDWCDGFAPEEEYTESDIMKWRMWRTTYEAEYQGG